MCNVVMGMGSLPLPKFKNIYPQYKNVCEQFVVNFNRENVVPSCPKRKSCFVMLESIVLESSPTSKPRDLNSCKLLQIINRLRAVIL